MSLHDYPLNPKRKFYLDEPPLGIDASAPENEEESVDDVIGSPVGGPSQPTPKRDESRQLKTQRPGAKPLGEKAEKVVAKQATTQVAEKAGSAVAGRFLPAIAGGWVGAVATAALAIRDALNSDQGRKILMYAAIAVVGLIVIVLVMIAAFISLLSGQPNIGGGGPVTGITNPVIPAILSRELGLVFSNDAAALRAATPLILNHLPPGADSAKVKGILDQLANLEDSLKTSAYGSDADRRNDLLTQRKDLRQQLYSALFPARVAARDKLLSKNVTFTTDAGCAPKKDVENLALTENLYTLLAEAADHASITVTCLVTGHRKYVGLAPQDGHPRCQDAHPVPGGEPSLHCTGRGVDLVPSQELRNYLSSNKARLHITELKDEGNHLHVGVSL